MPLTLPEIPAIEPHPIDRIAQKYREYCRQKELRNPKERKGERYEVHATLALHNKGLFTNGNQIGRWEKKSELKQGIYAGDNKEYDFVIPSSTKIRHVGVAHDLGIVLGECKSYRDGLAPYIKEGISQCIFNPNLGGFCLVTPEHEYQVYLQMVGIAIAILSGREATTGAGGSWQFSSASRNGKPVGRDMHRYFSETYYGSGATYAAPTAKNYVEILQNGYVGDITGQIKTFVNEKNNNRREAALYKNRINQRAAVAHFNAELAAHAGFVLACYQVKSLASDEMLDLECITLAETYVARNHDAHETKNNNVET